MFLQTLVALLLFCYVLYDISHSQKYAFRTKLNPKLCKGFMTKDLAWSMLISVAGHYLGPTRTSILKICEHENAERLVIFLAGTNLQSTEKLGSQR